MIMAGKGMLRVISAGAIMLCLVGTLRADNLEYRYEVGAMVGGSSYYGDANYSSLLNNMSLMGGIMGRYNINPRFAVKASLSAAGINGTTAGLDNKFPGENVEFSRMVYDLGAAYVCKQHTLFFTERNSVEELRRPRSCMENSGNSESMYDFV